jgi:hypothetical protein
MKSHSESPQEGSNRGGRRWRVVRRHGLGVGRRVDHSRGRVGDCGVRQFVEHVNRHGYTGCRYYREGERRWRFCGSRGLRGLCSSRGRGRRVEREIDKRPRRIGRDRQQRVRFRIHALAAWRWHGDGQGDFIDRL